MKVIICGGRDYHLGKYELQLLDELHKKYGFTEIVSGGCEGADKDGEKWAALNNIPVKQFIPDWVAKGRSAGPLRNQEMADYADACMVFPGGKGTEDMKNRANKAKLDVWKWGFIVLGIRGLKQIEAK